MDITEFLNTVRNIAIGTGIVGIGIPLAWRWGTTAFDYIYDRARKWQHDRLTIEHIRDQNALHAYRHVQRDANGQLGAVIDTRGQFRNLDTAEAFTLLAANYLDPMRVQMAEMQKTLLAMRGVNAGNAKTADQLIDGALPAVAWPDTLPIAEVFRTRRPTIADLVVGAYPTERGIVVVSESLHNLMHVLTVGASGWGKSAWLRAFIWQLARAAEPVQVIAIDTAGSEFNTLRDWNRLRYPVARSERDAVAVLTQVTEEIKRRRDQFEANAPMASKLTEYNKATGADLPPWVVMVDEGTNMLNQPGIGDPLRQAVQTARQYGVYILLAGQSAHSRVIETQTRDQFSTRMCFHTSPTSSRVVLDDGRATDLRAKGRAWVQLVGRELVEVQGPWVTREEFMAALTGGGPERQMPDSVQMPLDLHAQQPMLGKNRLSVAQVREMVDAGLSATEIARRAWGYDNARVIDLASSFIASLSDDNDSDDTGVVHMPDFARVNGNGESSLQRG